MSELFERIFCGSCVTPGLIIPRGAGLADVVMILRIGLHGNLRVAIRALEIEPEHFDSQVFFGAGLLAHVKFCAYVQVITTGRAFDGKWLHHSDVILLFFRALVPDQFLRVEIGWVVFN